MTERRPEEGGTEPAAGDSGSARAALDGLRTAARGLGAAVAEALAEQRRAAEQLAAFLDQARDELPRTCAPVPVALASLRQQASTLRERAETVLSRCASGQADAEAVDEQVSAELEQEAMAAEADLLQFVEREAELEALADEHLRSARGALGSMAFRLEDLRQGLAERRQELGEELDAFERGAREQVGFFLEASAARAAELEARVNELVASSAKDGSPSADEASAPRIDSLRKALAGLGAFAEEEPRALARVLDDLSGTMSGLARTQDSLAQRFKIG